VKRDVVGGLRLLVVPTIALIVIAGGAPGRLGLAVRIYALIVCAAALVVALHALRRAYPSETPLRPPSHDVAKRRQVPPSLARLEQEVALGVAGSFDLQYRLVPRLRSIAAGLLASRRRVMLDTDQAAARSILGEEAWELVRPARPAPRDRISRGVTPTELTHVLDSLEGI
jgi:hypothetical protein